MSDWLPGTKNDFGVYAATEEIEMQRAVKGWRGCPRVSLRLVMTDGKWLAALSWHFFTGSWMGSGRPLNDRSPAYPSRHAAIAALPARLRTDFANLSEPSMKAEAREMIAWAEGLCPAQADLFGGIAV